MPIENFRKGTKRMRKKKTEQTDILEHDPHSAVIRMSEDCTLDYKSHTLDHDPSTGA